MAKLERVATGMPFEQETDDLVAKFVLMVPTRWTDLCLPDLGGVQGPSDPPLDLVTLLTQGTVRALVTELQVAVMVASNLMGCIRPTIKPMDLRVADFNSRRASLPSVDTQPPYRASPRRSATQATYGPRWLPVDIDSGSGTLHR